MIRIRRVLGPLCVALCSALPTCFAQDNLSGWIVDPRGQPIESARVGVRVLSAQADDWSVIQEKQLLTGPDGRFATRLFEIGTIELDIHAEGKRPQRRWLTRPIQDLAISMAAASSLSGYVVWPDGIPRPGIHVWAVGSMPVPLGRATTDAEGRFEIRDLPAGWTVLRFVEIREKVPPLYDHAVELNLIAGRHQVLGEITLDVGSIEGTVVDRDGRPRAEADVVLMRTHHAAPGWIAKRTDEQGRFWYHSLPVDEYFLGISDEHPFVEADWRPRELSRVRVRNGKSSVELVMPGAVSSDEPGGVLLTGGVVDAVPSQSGSRYRVTARSELGNRSTMTDKFGRFRFAAMPTGRIEIVAHRSWGGMPELWSCTDPAAETRWQGVWNEPGSGSFEDSTRTWWEADQAMMEARVAPRVVHETSLVTVVPEGTDRHFVMLNEHLDLLRQTIEGRVLRDGRGAAGIAVRLFPSQPSASPWRPSVTLSDSSGRYRLRALRGRYLLLAHDGQGSTAAAWIEVTDRDSQRRDLSFDAAHAFSASFDPALGVERVELSSAELVGWPDLSVPVVNGTLRVSGLLPVTYDLRISNRDRIAMVPSVDLGEGPLDLDRIPLHPVSRAMVLVRDEQGRVLDDVKITTIGPARSIGPWDDVLETVPRDGLFLSGPPGPVTLKFECEGFRKQTVRVWLSPDSRPPTLVVLKRE
ncbi:MAG: carboxypeptidase-like regulatory domain-containing protein [Planctomycetota bacterium]